MQRIAVYTDSAETVAIMRQHLGRELPLRFARLSQLERSPPAFHNIIEADLTDTSRLMRIRTWLNGAPSLGQVVFIGGQASDGQVSRVEATRARAIGATHVIARPINMRALQRIFEGEAKAGAMPSEPCAENQHGTRAAALGLQGLFQAAFKGQAIEAAPIKTAANEVVKEIESQGLQAWLDAVRSHHSRTYQHCLLVTGLAVGFGQHLKFSVADRQRLSLAAMLHDIGKARIPVAILEKPTTLDADEMALMKEHPRYGVEALQGTGLPQEMLDVVLQHHEYLDGSGYPLGLYGEEICDLVRVVTISDVYAALIEERAYKPPLPHEEAYSMLVGMGEKLDQVLVREFRKTVTAR